jgi:hypothetical protein
MMMQRKRKGGKMKPDLKSAVSKGDKIRIYETTKIMKPYVPNIEIIRKT